MIYAWDQVEDMEIDWPEDNLCMLTVYNRESEGFLTFAEFVSEGCGSYLSIIPEIYEIFQPVIESSRVGIHGSTVPVLKATRVLKLTGIFWI